jgi:Ras-related protein Rab-1A
MSSSNSNLQELKFKILIIGDSAVGKTSILLKYLDNFFPQEHIATIGVEFRTKTLIKEKFKINLNIWDTAGQERFKSLTKSFFSGATGVVFVYDITRRESFDGVKSWIKDFEDYGKYDRVLCGNKVDLEKKREVNFDELKLYGMKKKIEVMETSAKTGINLNEAFDKLVDVILKNRTEAQLLREFGVNTKPRGLSITKNDPKPEPKKKCCK